MTCTVVKVRKAQSISVRIQLNSGESSQSLTDALKGGCIHALKDAYTGVLISP
jgi:hypothetical protein